MSPSVTKETWELTSPVACSTSCVVTPEHRQRVCACRTRYSHNARPRLRGYGAHQPGARAQATAGSPQLQPLLRLSSNVEFLSAFTLERIRSADWPPALTQARAAPLASHTSAPTWIRVRMSSPSCPRLRLVSVQWQLVWGKPPNSVRGRICASLPSQLPWAGCGRRARPLDELPKPELQGETHD